MEIFDMTGRKVYSELYLTSAELLGRPIHISYWAPGVYQIRLQYGNSIFCMKLVIVHQ